VEPVLDDVTLDAPWGAPGSEVVTALSSDEEQGLTEDEAARRRATLGSNVVEGAPPRTLLRAVGSQLRDSLIQVLLAASVLTLLTGDYNDTVVILLVVVANTALGASQEQRAEHAVAALAALSAPQARVVRGGTATRVAASDLVPGDLVEVEAGDVVPADGRVLRAAHLEVDEAPFTGESVPVAKNHEPVATTSAVHARSSMLHAGTVISRGRARVVVTSTGMRTEVGQLAELLDRQTSPRTPLQRRLARLSRQLALGVGALCVLVVVLGLARGLPLELLLVTGVSLAVAAVPESLPAVVTLSLALAAQRMAKRGALVRRLPAVETLGSVTVIASDKTGTLTDGVMTVRRLWTPTGEHEVTGHGYGPDGEVTGLDDPARRLLRAGTLCNDARVLPGPSGWSVVGDPTEGALLAAAAKAGLDVAQERGAAPRIAEEPFDASRARMTTVHETDDGVLLVCKGAPEAVLGMLAEPSEIADGVARRWAGEGLRVLAVAERRVTSRPGTAEEVAAAEHDLVLLGLAGLQDPPRADALEAVAQCRTAGIIPLMITGDHPATAEAVARRLGIVDAAGEVVTGDALRNGRRPDLTTRVYARTAPEQKLDIVRTWQEAGHVVAMTGDGVNDAPSLKRADVGVAMGRGGTDVARQSADVVLSDDDFATIVHAVEEGRRVYDNIRRFLLFGLSGGVAELLVMLVGPFLGQPLPLLPGQILWMNLLTHGITGVAMGAEQVEPDALRQPPRPPEEGVLGGGLGRACLALGVLLAATALLASELLGGDERTTRSVVFVTLTLQQLLVALALRSTRRLMIGPGWRGNPLLLWAVGANVLLLLASLYVPGLHGVLDTARLSLRTLAAAAGLALAAPVAIEITKLIRGRWRESA
jgi:Ca2+-transporting ATPase